jgi:hypothetical protein
LFTGSKPRAPKTRNPPVSRCPRDEQAEFISPRTTKRQGAAEAKKKTTMGPIKPMDNLSKNQLLEVRKVNPYLVEKNVRLCPNTYFYRQNQERIYHEIYGTKEFHVSLTGR